MYSRQEHPWSDFIAPTHSFMLITNREQNFVIYCWTAIRPHFDQQQHAIKKALKNAKQCTPRAIVVSVGILPTRTVSPLYAWNSLFM